jgi:sugar lactone lactonase YvrE
VRLGFVDGPLAQAAFYYPRGIAAGTDGTLYVADSYNNAIRVIK